MRLPCRPNPKRRGGSALGKGGPKLPARVDADLREHLVQVPFDRSRAEEQQRPDLWIRLAVCCEPCNLSLLGGEVAWRFVNALPDLFAGRGQFATCTFGEVRDQQGGI